MNYALALQRAKQPHRTPCAQRPRAWERSPLDAKIEVIERTGEGCDKARDMLRSNGRRPQPEGSLTIVGPTLPDVLALQRFAALARCSVAGFILWQKSHAA